MSVLTLPALRAKQNGRFMYLVSIPAGQLARLDLKVEPFDASLVKMVRNGEISTEEFLDQTGYQRPLENNRVNRFCTYLKDEKSISPTVLLINDRDGSCNFDERKGLLSIKEGASLYIYDGQHREKGFLKALKEDPERFAEFPVFAVITHKLPKLGEMQQFKIINDNTKRVSTALVIDIMSITHMVDGDAEIDAPVKDLRQETCNFATQAIATRKDSPWCDKVILTNERKWKKSEIKDDPDLANQRILGNQSFRRSLEPVYAYLEVNNWPGVAKGMRNTSTSLQERGEKMADIVVEFWKAIERQMPEPFEEATQYALLSGSLGVYAMHKVLVSLLRDMHKGRRDWVADEFVTMTSGSGWFTEADRWAKDSGEVASYSGYRGGDLLARVIIESLEATVAE